MPERTVSLGLMLKAECLAPGQMGTVRNSMFTRETLMRPCLGRQLTRGRSIPPPNFVYGRKYEQEPDAISKCFTWCTCKRNDNTWMYGVDFKKTNIESAKAGIHKVPEWMKFRNEKDYHHKPIKSTRRHQKPEFPFEMTFGRPNRPSTPIGCVLSHYYKREFDKKAVE